MKSLASEKNFLRKPVNELCSEQNVKVKVDLSFIQVWTQFHYQMHRQNTGFLLYAYCEVQFWCISITKH